MSIVFICNNGQEPHKDGCDGQRYEFPIGKTVAVPLYAAAHMFGYGESDKRRALVRIGKMKTNSGLEDGLKWLGTFAFDEPSEPELPDLSANSEDAPAVRPKRAKSVLTEDAQSAA